MSGATTRLSLASIDDYLGPAEKRFFGTGYRRSKHHIGQLLATSAEAERVGVTASVTVTYPRDWSKKTDEIDIAPHLSSIDTLILGAQLCEAHLAHAYGLDDEQRRAVRMRRVKLIAGDSPQEDLSDLPAHAYLRGTQPLPEEPGAFLSVYDCRIGAMRARCEVEHAMGGSRSEDGEFANIEDALGSAADRYYGSGYTRSGHRIHDVRADMADLSAEAAVSLDLPSCPAGIDGNCQPSASLVDCFVTNLQLAQVLMYEMDSVKRSESNTLWMLKTVFDATKRRHPAETGRPLALRTQITGKHLLPLRGSRWRNAEIAGEFGGISLRCSLAHELPADSAATAV
jgi:hypothetical protein